MSKYYFKDEHFVIENYDNAKPFASFLPSIAGLYGIPAWVYYVNRGQAIAGFGIENKDNPIMDFVPANMAYRRTELVGFRTFIKIDDNVYEFFSSTSNKENVLRKMSIGRNTVSISETNSNIGFEINVEYVNITNRPYPGLIRQVRIKNLNNKPMKVELLDGLANIWPYGINDFTTKNMSNLGVAWFDVLISKDGIPFYKNRSTTSDTSSVGTVDMGHFYASYSNKKEGTLPVIYDFEQVFGQNTSLTKAEGFKEKSIKEMLANQTYVNKFNCAFTAFEGEIDGELVIGSIIGRMSSMKHLDEESINFSIEFVRKQIKMAIELGESITNDCVSKTNNEMFDAYIRQCFMDNLLRGGYPLIFKGKDKNIVYHVYSRVHGDMEREYNYFVVEPGYFSQGNGNYRDVNQNRRNDVFFVKESGLFNLKQFMELIQMDGHNPLGIQGSKLKIDSNSLPKILDLFGDNHEIVKNILSDEFSPGTLLNAVNDYNIKIKLPLNQLVNEVMAYSTQEIQANFGHGYWSDHWTYNLDLIDNFLNIFPDKKQELLFDEEFRYFVSPARVLPRSDKYVLTQDGKVRQYDAIISEDKEKIEKCKLLKNKPNWQKTTKHEVYTSSLYTKILSLIVNKFTLLDQYGIGVMMNADKPGWNDAMNGLPGIFGSGVSEAIELKRLIDFLLGVDFDKEVKVYEELYHLIEKVEKYLSKFNNSELDDMEYWNHVQDAREEYLEQIRFGNSGKEVSIKISKIIPLLQSLNKKVDDGLEKAIKMNKDEIIPTYMVYEATSYEVIKDKFHPINHLPNVKVHSFKGRPLPLFLEAPARYLKIANNKSRLERMYENIRASQMFDEKIQMYITSESLEKETLEIGRARAFTPGWLERESCFMHMEYKYLLGLLKSGLYEQFYTDLKTCLLPFTDPSVYGRSTLENSSFIASSVNPNKENHGRGFVARLTGTTSETLSMWILMMMGKHLFTYEDNTLTFRLKPILSADMFDENNEVSFRLLGQCDVTYINSKRLPTFGENSVKISKYVLLNEHGNEIEVNEEAIKGDLAYDIREGLISKIKVYLY